MNRKNISGVFKGLPPQIEEPAYNIISAFLLILVLLSGEMVQSQRVNCFSPSRLISRFGFKQLYGGGVLLRAKMDNYPDTLNFIFDTGSGGISLDSTTAAELKIAITPTDILVTGIAGRTKVGFIYSQQLRLPGLTIDSLDFHVTNYEILSSFYGEKINGIIGYSVLKNYVVELDYDSSLISFYTRGELKYPRGGYLLRPYINFQPFQQASLNDQRNIHSNFIFDIGANICLMLSASFDNDSIPIRAKRKRFIKEADGVGGKIEMQATVVKEFKLGPYKFRNVPVCLFDDLDNVTAYPFSGGIIGNDLLRRFNMILNYGLQEIYLKPNSHFHDNFDYTYTGIELFNINGENQIGGIVAGSPAAKAGLMEGDIILGINNKFSVYLSELKDALMKSSGRINLIIIRKGILMEFHFRTESIL